MNLTQLRLSLNIFKLQFGRVLLVVTLTVSLVVILLGVRTLAISRDFAIQNARVQSRNLALSINQNISATFRRIDHTLFSVTHAIERNLSTGGLNLPRMKQVLAAEEKLLPEAVAIRVTDAEGRVILNNPSGDPSAGFTDRPYFPNLRDHPEAGVFITEPILGKFTQKWVITSARRYNLPDGSFGGVVVAPVFVEHFQELLAGFDVGAGGMLTLRTSAGGFVTRQPVVVKNKTLSMGDRTISGELQAIIDSGLSQTTYSAVAPFDQTRRTLTFQRIEVAPYFVVASLAEEDYLAEWKTGCAMTSTIILLFLAGIWIMTGFLWFSWKSRERDAVMLRENANRLRTILQAAMDGFWLLDLQGRLLEVNDAYCRMSGYSQQELLAMRIPDLEAIESAEDVATHIRKVMTHDEDRFETRHRRKDGTLYDVEVSAQYWSADGGRFVVFLRDITDRKRAEEKLRESEAKYRNLFESMAEDVYFWELVRDENGQIKTWRVVDVNPPALKTWGRTSREGTIGRTADEICPGATDHFMPIVQKIMAEGVPYSYEDYFPPPVDKHFRFTSVPLGEYFITTGADITGIKKIQEALKDSEYFFKESQRAASIGSYKTDFVAGYWQSSEVLDQIFGIERNYDRHVQGWLDIVHPDDREMMDRYLREDVIGKRKPFNKEYRIIRKSDGEIRWVNGLGEVKLDAEGKVISMMGTIQDITDRKRAGEREKGLQEKLERAARMESLGVLAGGVAHDLNNVLGPIVGLPDLIAEYIARHGNPSDPEHEDTLESIQSIKASGQRAVGVVSDLVVMGRRGQFLQAPVNVNRVVEQVLDSKQIHVLRARRPDVHLSAQLSDEVLWCIGSDSRLARVLVNLVGNAAEAIDGQGNVVVSTRKEVFTDICRGYEDVPAGDYVAVEVTDTGCGMDANTIARIFEPFFSMKAPSERSGSGLGLSVVHGLVKDHAGFLDVKSEPGKGTTFTVYLPGAPAVEAEAASASDKLPGGHEKILVVDDEPDQQFLTRRQLAKLGYDVTTVSRGEEALALFEAAGREGKPAPFNLVLMDMLMPGGLDGLSTSKAILQLFPQQRLVILSGHAPEKYEAQVKALGIDWLPKPCLAAELAAAIRVRLDSARERCA